jgi:hypothetical protein
MSDTNRADDLQRQMQQVRMEMREDMQVMVENASELADWTWYVRTYPWISLGAAAVVGYLIVPPRGQPIIRPNAKDLLELAKHQKIVVKMEEPKSSPGIIGTLVRLAAGSLLQGGMAVVSAQLDQYLKQPRETSSAHTKGNGRGTVHG